MSAIERDSAALYQASLIGMAVNEPKLLAREQARLAARARALTARRDGAGDLRAYGAALLERMRRGRVLEN